MINKLYDNDPALYESARLRTLASYAVLDTEPDIAFDRVTKLAADIFKVPLVMISLVDQRRQWFKSSVGIAFKETSRDISLCAHALRSDAALVVLDTQTDPRFAHNPLVTGPPFIRFYAGAPLLTKDGFVLGTLCICDTKPHTKMHAADLERLADFACIIMSELELRKTMRQCDEVRAMLDSALEFAKIAIWEMDVVTDSVRWQGDSAVWGADTKDTLVNAETAFNRMLHEDRERVRTELRTALQENTLYNTSFRINHPELGVRWLAGRGHQLILDGQVVVRGINFDITEVKNREQMNALLTRELHHRMRNLFATVRAIISLTKSSATSVDDYCSRIEDRLLALDRAQHVLLNSDFTSATLHALMQEISDTFPRILWQGPNETVPENILVSLALILYELATNAAKYGGLTNKNGGVNLTWTFDKSQESCDEKAEQVPDKMTMVWSEHGGARVKKLPQTSGFGTQLIERTVRSNLGGTIVRSWDMTGLTCTIVIPVAWQMA